MTFTIKTRGASAQPVLQDFICPECGPFELLAPRDVDGVPCPDCGELAPWAISAPKPQVWSKPCTAAIKGGDMKDRPPGMLDTRPLAEGMSLESWKKWQAGITRERRHQQLLKRGAIQKKIFVG